MSALIRSQIKINHKKIYFCDRCLHYFIDEYKLKTHELDCSKINTCTIKLAKNNILQFNNFKCVEQVPFVIYADFECILKPTENGRAFQEHEAFSIGMYLKCSVDDERSKYVSYRKKTAEDKTPAEWVIEQFKILIYHLEEVYNNVVEMDLLDFEECVFQSAKKCHICLKKF